MVLDSDKYHFMCIGKNKETETHFYNDTEMKNYSELKGCVRYIFTDLFCISK